MTDRIDVDTQRAYARLAGFMYLFGSVCYVALWIARLLAPDTSWLAPYASAPILVAEVVGGFWLLVRAIDVSAPVGAVNPR
ncbi:MAG: hypothetical protein HYU87_02680 [Chloroflexi bacterium]|nr:hypothetical protein [Chloroflexota bacterium]